MIDINNFAWRLSDKDIRERARAMNHAAASLSADTFTQLSTQQMTDLLAAYKIAYAADNGDEVTLRMLETMRWALAARHPDIALDAVWWVFCPASSFDRYYCRILACVIRDALRRKIDPTWFVSEGERSLPKAERRVGFYR